MFCFCRSMLKFPIPKNQNIRYNLRCFQCHVVPLCKVNILTLPPTQISKAKLSKLSSPHLLNPVVRDIRFYEGIFKKYKNNPLFASSVLKNLRGNDFQPSYVVDILRIASENADCSPEFIQSFLLAVQKGKNEDNINFYPSAAEKLEALQVLLVYKSYNLIKLVKDVLKINEDSTDVKNLINDLINSSKLCEAALCISAFSLQEEYSIEKIVIPLFLDGKLPAAMTLLSTDAKLQVEVAKVLDSYLIVKQTETATNPPVMNSKRVYRSLNKIIKSFKLSTDHCKNFRYIRTKGAINLLIKRRSEQSISEKTWEDMMMTLIGDDVHLKEHLISKLAANNDKDTALKMMQKLNIQRFDFNPTTDSNSNFEIIEDGEEEIEIEDSVEYLKFNLSSSDIKFIDTEEKFKIFISDITQTPGVIGIDSEWKPNFGLAPERLALMQLATSDKVYVLDLISLYDCLKTEHWDHLMDGIFGNDKIIKLGCGVLSDIQMLSENVKVTTGKKLRFSHVLDMVVFYDKLLEIYPNEMKEVFGVENEAKSLSKLCELILGNPLNKEERLCNWEIRPLTDAQLEYAALDAHCLVQMFDKLKKVATEKCINFNHIAKVTIYLTYRNWNPKKKLKKVGSTTTFEIQKPIHIGQFKVVLDSSLETLGKQLRQVGADVQIISDLNAENAVKVFQSEQRIVICSHKLWSEVKAIAPNTIVYRVDEKSKEISGILQRFNVSLTTKNILSRCATCNSEERIKLSTEVLKVLLDQIESGQSLKLDDNEETNDSLRTINSMISSGIQIKNFSDNLIKKQSSVLLCTKCGTVQ